MPINEDGWDQSAFLDLDVLESEAKAFHDDSDNAGVELDSYNTPFFTILSESFFIGESGYKVAPGEWAFLDVLGACGKRWPMKGFGGSMQSAALFLDLENGDGTTEPVVACRAISPEEEEREEEEHGDDDDFDWDGPRVVVERATDLNIWLRDEDNEDDLDVATLTFEKL